MERMGPSGHHGQGIGKKDGVKRCGEAKGVKVVEILGEAVSQNNAARMA